MRGHTRELYTGTALFRDNSWHSRVWQTQLKKGGWVKGNIRNQPHGSKTKRQREPRLEELLQLEKKESGLLGHSERQRRKNRHTYAPDKTQGASCPKSTHVQNAHSLLRHKNGGCRRNSSHNRTSACTSCSKTRELRRPVTNTPGVLPTQPKSNAARYHQ